MTDESTLKMEAANADRAKALLADPILKAAFDALEAGYSTAWMATGINDSQTREKLFLAMKILPAVRRNIETMVMNGAIARKQLANIEEDHQRAQKRR